MKSRSLKAEVEREREFLANQEVGSGEYIESLERLMALDKAQNAHKEILSKNVIEACKITISIVLPVVGLVGITAQEKEITFTGALREYTKYFLPKKN